MVVSPTVAPLVLDRRIAHSTTGSYFGQIEPWPLGDLKQPTDSGITCFGSHRTTGLRCQGPAAWNSGKGRAGARGGARADEAGSRDCAVIYSALTSTPSDSPFA